MRTPDTVVSQGEDTFAILESNRRVSCSLLQEAAHTSKLTRWVVGLTVAVAALTVLLVAAGSVDPVRKWRALDDAVRAGVYGPG